MIRFGLAGMLFILLACSEEGHVGVTVSDAKAAAKNAAGANAVDCGTVDIQQSKADANCCLASNRAQSIPAYALYMLQGFDSVVAQAVSMDASGVVTYFSFSGNVGDFQEPIEGQVTEQTCQSPVLAENACSNATDLPFACS